MQMNPEAGPQDEVLVSHKHLLAGPGGAHSHLTKHQVFLKLLDHGLKYDQERRQLEGITLIGKRDTQRVTQIFKASPKKLL